MDNTNMKTRSIRAEETVLGQFKELSEQFPNQSIALESLLNAYKMQTAKVKVVTRQIEAETAMIKAEQALSDKQLIINSLNEQLATATISAEKNSTDRKTNERC